VKTRTVRLSEVCELINDGTHSSPLNSATGAFRYITSKNVRPGRLDLADVTYVGADVHTEIYARCPVRMGDVLYVKDGVNAGTAAFNTLQEPFSLLSSVALIRPNRNLLNPLFLVHWLNSPLGYQTMIRNKSGSAITRLILQEIRQARVPLPSLSDQHRIAGQLEQADRLRRTRRYALELTDTFLPAAFLQLFGKTGDQYPLSTVEEVAADEPHAIRTGPFGSQLLHSEFTDSGIAVLGIDNAVNNRFVWDERRFITPEKYEQLKRYTVFPGDVLITIMGTCGRCAIVPDDIPPAINTKHLCCITLDQKRCLPIYLHGAFLHHPYVRHQLRVATKGAIMEGLNMEIIKSLRIPVPPLLLQQQFAALVERVERLRSVQRESLRQADHLFSSLLHRTFTDKL
jgi:type I restriction enzyme, S subunit